MRRAQSARVMAPAGTIAHAQKSSRMRLREGSDLPLLLGIDTGGTYTDAVLFEEEQGIVASAKALTTRHDLGVGIGAAMDAVLMNSGRQANDIALVSLSTTLATNALVEGQGGRVALVLIGFPANALSKAGLAEALGDDPCLSIAGGHDAQGQAGTPMNCEALADGVERLRSQVAAFAVAGLFAVRNPEHEIAARDLIRARTGLPVTCSHELSSKLDGPRRAMTCILNARLVSLIVRLIEGARDKLQSAGIDAKLMVVRGDGALISADVAALRPIETILSGPAASLVGAAYLTGVDNAVVADIGGTTTDVAVLRDGRPRLDPVGANVGGFQTMVEAVDMRTSGLGGDSEVQVSVGGLESSLLLGPRRAVPLCAFANDHPDLVNATLDRQLAGRTALEFNGRFAVSINRSSPQLQALGRGEEVVFSALADGPKALDRLITARSHLGALDRLRSRGLVLTSALTPTDAAHALDLHALWDRDVAVKGLSLFARQKDGRGLPIAADSQALAGSIVHTLVENSARALLDCALQNDGHDQQQLARYLLARNAEPSDAALVRTRMEFSLPVVGLGASAATYYPRVAARLGTRCVVPEYAGVANAVGAVVGRVRTVAQASISQSADNRFQVFSTAAPRKFDDLESALAHARESLELKARRDAQHAGAGEVSVHFEQHDKRAMVEGHEILVESTIVVTASGRPRFAS